MLYINLTPLLKLSSKILFVWSCDLSLMLYIVLIRKLVVILSSLTHLSWRIRMCIREKNPRILFICDWLYLATINKIMILVSYKLCIKILMILYGHFKVITCAKHWLLSPPPRDVDIWSMWPFRVCYF
jgi:hypothetical protein